MWVVGSLAAARPGWDRSRFPSNHHHSPPSLLPPSPPRKPQEARRLYRYNISAAFIPGWVLRDTRDEHVDLECWELGASARPRKKKLSGINKQTDRLREHR